jgi:hypothetical protein
MHQSSRPPSFSCQFLGSTLGNPSYKLSIATDQPEAYAREAFLVIDLGTTDLDVEVRKIGTSKSAITKSESSKEDVPAAESYLIGHDDYRYARTERNASSQNANNKSFD